MKPTQKASSKSAASPAPAPSAPVESTEKQPSESGSNAGAKGFPGRSTTGRDERISLKVVDGKLDHESLRPETAQRFKEVLAATVRDDAMRKWVGLTAEVAAQTDVQIVPPSLVGNFFDMISNIEASIMASKTGLSFAECQKFLSFNEREHKNYDEQGARLANQYIPAEWLQRVDLWMFLAGIISLTGVKIQALLQYQKKELERIGKLPSHDEAKPTAPAQPEPAPAQVRMDASATAATDEKTTPGQSFEKAA